MSDPPPPILQVTGLRVDLPVGRELRRVLHDVSFTIAPGEALGLIGESGSGKSMTTRAIGRLLPRGSRVGGEIRFDGASVGELRGADLLRYRREGVAMIFQDPRAHINPVRAIGDFLTEILVRERGVARSEARRRAVATLDDVGIDNAERRLSQYPHELSGGMLQRVMIAAAMLAEPRLILADEPTTALDVTTQAEVMAILDELRRERNLALLFISHDLELAAAVCDRSAVMYAGSIVEMQASAGLERAPRHPYSAALLAARPDLNVTTRRLAAIPGRPLSAFEVQDGCAFAGRCAHHRPACLAHEQVLRPLGDGLVRCERAEEIAGALVAGEVERHG